MYEWPQRALIISLKNDNSRGGNTLKKKNKPNFRSFQKKEKNLNRTYKIYEPLSALIAISHLYIKKRRFAKILI